MLFNKKKSKKNTIEAPQKITMWAVIDNEFPDVPITFTATHADAVAALDQYLYLKHYMHFRLWCQVHDRKIDHADNWRAYAEKVIYGELDKQIEEDPSKAPYILTEIHYEPNIIASMLRSINHCTPLGCKFDTDEELDEYSMYFSDKAERVERGEDKFTPLEEALNTLFEDLEQEHCDECVDTSCENNPAFEGKGGKRTDA